MKSTRRSFYLTMADGVKIALDLHQPYAHGARPTILHPTRYFRSVAVRLPGKDRLEALLASAVGQLRPRFLEAGYAWIDMDVRGSGASYGWRACPWSPAEIDDAVEVLDWIIAQPWSNRAVGGVGNSYGGTAVELLAARGHDALKAVAPRFRVFDVFADVVAPGGVRLKWFSAQWGKVNGALDRDAFHDAVAQNLRIGAQGRASVPPDAASRASRWLWRRFDSPTAEVRTARWVQRLARAGVRPVDDDVDRKQLREAVAEHARNYDVEADAQTITYRDDAPDRDDPFEHRPDWSDARKGSDRFSPHSRVDALRASNTAVLNTSGWHDVGYQHAAIKRHLALAETGRSWLLLGPWDHGGTLNTSPHDPSSAVRFDHAGALLEFFDAHLKEGAAPYDRPRVRYFTMGAERWDEAPSWPPHTHPKIFHLSPKSALLETPPDPDTATSDAHRLDPAASTGTCSRWRSFIGPHAFIGYPDRAERDARLPTYDSAPLPAPLEIAGHPILTLEIAADAQDGTLFAYLEAVHPDGRVTYITEGCLRALHRCVADPPLYDTPAPTHTFLREHGQTLKPGERAILTIGLLPVAYRFAAGDRVRIALAGADVDSFGAPDVRFETLRVFHGGSTLALPVRCAAGR